MQFLFKRVGLEISRQEGRIVDISISSSDRPKRNTISFWNTPSRGPCAGKKEKKEKQKKRNGEETKIISLSRHHKEAAISFGDHGMRSRLKTHIIGRFPV